VAVRGTLSPGEEGQQDKQYCRQGGGPWRANSLAQERQTCAGQRENAEAGEILEVIRDEGKNEGVNIHEPERGEQRASVEESGGEWSAASPPAPCRRGEQQQASRERIL